MWDRVVAMKWMGLGSRAAAVVGALVAGCGNDTAGEPLCIPGQVVRCDCAGGATGIQLCLESGRYDLCSCEAPSAGQDAGREAGAGAGGGSGMGGDPPDTGAPDAEPPDAGQREPAREGELWGACRESDDCSDDLECAANQSAAFGGSGIGYCSERCLTSSGPGSDNRRRCTPPQSGSVEVICSPLSTLCELGSCEDARCPAGMRCQELDTRFGTSFECGY